MFEKFSETIGSTIAIVVLIIGIIIFIMGMLQWYLWMTKKGRFAQPLDEKKAIRFIIGQLLVNIINDFRHLLALIIVTIFAIALIWAFNIAGSKLEDIGEALQIVTSTLGGLIGSIIGYYFGESAARKSMKDEKPAPSLGDIEADKPSTEDMIPAPIPKEKKDGD